MKTILIFIICCASYTSFAQLTTVWEEDFISYTDSSGVEVSNGAIVETGDFNTSFTKWTIDASGVNLSNEGAGAQVNKFTNDIFYPRFVANNTGGDLIWESESIDVSAYTKSFMTVIISKIGDLAAGDYIDVYWRLSAFSYILINNGTGHTYEGNDGDECWETKK